MSTFDLLAQAIREKKQVLAVYDNFSREMCPHALGYKDGIAKCLFYQYAGDSSGTIYPQTDWRADKNWRCMDVDKLFQVTLRDGQWYSRSKHTARQSCVDNVVVEVANWL